MQDTIWKTHPEYTDYEVSDSGRVRSTNRINAAGSRVKGRELVTFKRKGGYFGGNISVNAERINFEVHAFVCETFHGTRPVGLDVRHLNGDKADNRAVNLAWGTKSENSQDIIRHGRHHELNKTHCPRGHEYTEANTYRAPSRPAKRVCRACNKINDLLRAHKRWPGSRYTPELLATMGIATTSTETTPETR